MPFSLHFINDVMSVSCLCNIIIIVCVCFLRCSCPRFGDTCCAVTRILVMSSFLVACVTLFWMHIELRKHFYQLTDRINIGIDYCICIGVLIV